MTPWALRPVERPAALLRGALAAFSGAGPLALCAGTTVDAVSALPHALRACAVAAVVVVALGALPWRARPLCLPVVVALLGLSSPAAAMSAAAGSILTALLER